MLTESNSDISDSLEEFGLSKYEARAYLTMIGKGSLGASEIAYYANLPRTKIYQTIKKLEKKRLAVISKQKPLICSAIPPEEAFAEIVNLHERRVKNMKKIIDRLQRINDEGKRPKGSEERRYFILDASSALEKIGGLMTGARSSINAMLDQWGLRLISQCRPSLVRALTAGVRIRLLLGPGCVGSENTSQLPEGIELRVGEVHSDTITIDSIHMLSIDSSNGKAAMFSSIDSFGVLQSKNFEEAWSKASEVKFLLHVDPTVASKALELARILENGMSLKMLDYAVGGAEMPVELLQEIDEKYGLKISDMSAAEIMDLIDSALKISCLGGLRHDRSNNIVSLQSKIEGKHVLPWAIVLGSYFKHAGNEPHIMQQGKTAQLVHLRLSRPV